MRVRDTLSVICIGIGVVLLFGAGLFLYAADAEAQCGTQMSSCKNCHEVQAEKPVNADGTGWHQSHAFGDFCQFCHSGNVQSMVKEEAHKGMVAPLEDVQASCANCHPNDTLDKANVYAVALGVEVGKGGGAAAEPGADAVAEAAEAAPADAAPAEPVEAAALVTGEGKLIDYNKRYEEAASGSAPVNWGNVIVLVLIALMLLGGGGFVVWNERRLRGAAAPSVAPKPEARALPEIKDYPPDVLALLPQLAQLTPAGRIALRRLLEDPAEASELLYSLSQLDADLLLRVRNLDERARSLLMALSGA